MPFIMSGDHVTAVFNGDYDDFGSGGRADESKYVDVTPPRDSRRFTGQQKYLDQLEGYLASPSPSQQVGASAGALAGNEERCALLYGIGGVGKTQLALKSAERNSKRFWRIFWIDASSSETMELGFKSIAQDPEAKAAGIGNSARMVLSWLSGEGRDSLLIYDNADRPPEEIEDYLPTGQACKVLLTSRNPNMARLTSHKGVMKVDDMNEDDATSLLLKWVTKDGELSADVKKTARSIVQTLYCLPLAVDQAGAAIHSGLCAIDEYLSMYSSRRKDLVSHPSFKGASNYGRAVYTTWDLSYRVFLEAVSGGCSYMTSDAAESAILIIETFAFFRYDHISEEIMKRAAESPEILPWCNKSDGDHDSSDDNEFLRQFTRRFFILNSSGSWDPFPFREGIQILSSFSLIGSDTSWRSYSVHPLVHSWSRDRMTEEDRKIKCRSASAVLAHSITRKFLSSDYAFRRNLIPHIQSCSSQKTQVLKSDVYAENEFVNFGFAYRENGFYEEAGNLEVKVMETRIKILGREHVDTLASMANLTLTYLMQGRHGEAEKLGPEILELREKVLGREHPHTLRSMANLAWTWKGLGRNTDAIELMQESVDLSMQVLASDHEDAVILK